MLGTLDRLRAYTSETVYKNEDSVLKLPRFDHAGNGGTNERTLHALQVGDSLEY